MSQTPTPRARPYPLGRGRAESRTSDAAVTGEHAVASPAVKWQGRYRLGEVLGEGGMGVVREAYDLLLDRVVAIKEIRTDGPLSGPMLAREARALAAVEHPAVVRVYSVYPDAAPPFLVMERAHGRSLASILAAGPIGLARSLRVLRQIASGLDALHQAEIIHGDVKPANVIVDDDDGVKIIDAGLAPFFDSPHPDDVLGTPSYIAPERASGRVTPPALTSRSDVYSFGIVAYQMLTGRLPFHAARPEDLMHAHVTRRPAMPSYVAGLSTEFDAPIARALAKQPAHRTETCTALVEALATASRGADDRGRRLRVLVADDDEGTRLLLMAVLGAHFPGASVVLCGSGRSVMDAITSEPSVAVLDLGMPEPSGIELVRRVREASPSTAIVIVTGSGSGTEREAARALGVKHFVVKPFELEELVRAIHQAVGREPPG